MIPVTPQNEAGCLMDPPVSEPRAHGTSSPATASADPPDEPPGTLFVSHGFLVSPKYDVSVVLPMANSSMLVCPTITAPASLSFTTASAVYVGTKFDRILDEQLVCTPSWHILSFIAIGTPARGPLSSPASIFFCTSSAWASAPSRSTVTKLL